MLGAILIPALLLLAVALWGVYETGRKFRAEFALRGRTWESVSAEVDAGRGMLVVDSVWGPPRGLGHPVIWWMPGSAGEQEDLLPRLESPEGAKLVKCPRRFRTVEALRARFGAERVRVHGWNIGIEVQDIANKR